MTQLMDASNQLVNRPADEHFASFNSMRTAAAIDQRNHREVELSVNDLRFTSLDGSIQVMRKDGGASYGMNYYSFGQLCQKVGATRTFIGSRLSPRVAVTALNDAIVRVPDEQVRLLLGTVTKAEGETTGPALRALTSTGYCRVWDADMLRECHEWLLPNGFTPALPTINTNEQRDNILGNNKPCLFRGDRDSFAFFMTPDKVQEGHGGRPVRRGVLVGNSEVGARSLWTKRFVFDDVCANFIIWGASAVKSRRIIHRGDNDAKLLKRFRDEIRKCAPELAETELQILRHANEVTFAADANKAAERLTKQFNLTRAFAEQALAWATHSENKGTNELSHAWVANGVTSAAKVTGNADALVAMAEVGGDIFAAAAGEGV